MFFLIIKFDEPLLYTLVYQIHCFFTLELNSQTERKSLISFQTQDRSYKKPRIYANGWSIHDNPLLSDDIALSSIRAPLCDPKRQC